MSNMEKFVRKLQERAHNREPITLFGANYVPADDVGLLKMIVAGLEVENAKLRELVHDFADAIKNDDGFGVDLGWMLDRMCELGIEVRDD